MSDNATRFDREGAVLMEVEESVSTKGRSRTRDNAHLFTAVLFALFVVLLLMGILVGTNVYRSLYASGERTDATRLSTSYLANQVRANDQIDAVACAWVTDEGIYLGIADEDGLAWDDNSEEHAQNSLLQGPALVLRETLESGVYETRIYRYNNQLVQEYALADSPYNPEGATVVADTSRFEFRYEHGLVRITTDAGETCVALRTAGGEVR